MSKSRSNTQELLQYWNGDHFKSWIGPTIPPDTPDYARKMALLERVFQSANILAECAGNWKDGLVSEPFRWHLKGQDGERADTQADGTAAKAELLLQRWLDWVNQQAVAANPNSTHFKQADVWAEFVLSLGVLGEGSLRLWQPARYADDPDPVKRIHLHAPKVGSVEVKRSLEDDFVDQISYTYGQGKREVQVLDGDQVLVAIDGETDLLEVESGGRWLIQHCTGESIFTLSAKRLQNALNHCLTMIVRNNESAGFREKTFLNAEFPTDEDGNPLQIERGPGRDLWLYGVASGQDQSGYSTVGVHESQPVNNASLAESIQITRTLIYLEFGQGHLLGGEGPISGESRIQMRQGFELRLRGWQRRVEGAIANILNIVLRILGFEQYEAVVQLQITTGKLSAEERAAIISEFQTGLLSKATAIAKLGTADVDSELALIEEEAEQGVQRRDIPNEALPNPLNRAKAGQQGEAVVSRG